MASENELKALMVLALDGDALAYKALLRLLVPRLRAFFGRSIRSPDAVEDLVQETLMAVHRCRATYDRDRPFLPWMFTIARYKIVDHLRRNRNAQLMDDLDAQFAAPDNEPAIAVAIDIERLLDLLPSKQRRVIRATKIEGLSIAEAAAAAGISQSDAKVSIHRGLRRLSMKVREFQ